MTIFLILLSSLMLASGRTVFAATSESADSVGVISIEPLQSRLGPGQNDDVLWLARCIYSESDRPHEQRLVAWVVRNRVETAYRGETYRDVVLEDRQFSVFNSPTPRRERILKMTPKTPNPAWQRAYAIADQVYHAPASARPFSQTTRHFYSPISMIGRAMPEWAVGAAPLDAQTLGVDPQRFRFFDNLESATDPLAQTQTVQQTVTRLGSGRTPIVTRVGRTGGIARPARPLRPGRSLR